MQAATPHLEAARATGAPHDVAVIVPCYNYGRYLAGCVQSVVAAASASRLQVIVVDDCSTDDTPQVCERLRQQYACVTIVRHERNRGHIATYNHGLGLADAEFVHLISADDQLTPRALDRAVSLMRMHPDVGIVYGGVVSGPEPPPSVRERGRSRYSIVRGLDWIQARCTDGRNPIYSPEVTLRSSVAREAGPYEPRLPRTADLEMWLRCAARSNVAVIEGVPQAFYRRHQNNMHTAHGKEGLLKGLRERATAYEIFFSTHAALVPHADALLRQALDRVARDALHRTGILFDQSEGQHDELSQGVEMARSLTNRAEQTAEWRRVQSRLAQRSQRAPLVLAYRKLAVRMQQWLHWQRTVRDLGHRGLPAIAYGSL
jgi:hypothetical protein